MVYRANEELVVDRSILVVGLNGNVLGIDRATGEIRWRGGLGWSGEVFLCVGYGVVVASADPATLVCFDYLTGAVRWNSPTSKKGRATILIEPDQIVCAKTGYIDCFAPDGRRMWTQPLEGFGYGRISVGYPGNVAQADDPGSE